VAAGRAAPLPATVPARRADGPGQVLALLLGRLAGPEAASAALWVSACKMARHLGLAVPPRDTAGLSRFLAANAPAYMRKMGRLPPLN